MLSRYSNSTDTSLQDVDSLLTYIPADDRETWISVGMALKSEFGDLAFPLFDQRSDLDAWNTQCKKYTSAADWHEYRQSDHSPRNSGGGMSVYRIEFVQKTGCTATITASDEEEAARHLSEGRGEFGDSFPLESEIVSIRLLAGVEAPSQEETCNGPE